MVKIGDLAAIVRAGSSTFTAERQLTNPEVKSRMLLCCREGRGTVEINKEPYSVERNDFLLLPWNHHVNYLPDAHYPFILDTCHIIPKMEHGTPFMPEVSHAQVDEFSSLAGRSDEYLPDVVGVFRFEMAQAQGIYGLMRYGGQLYQEDRLDEHHSRWIGKALIEEIIQLPAKRNIIGNHQMDPRLKRVINYIKEHLDEGITLSELCEIAECSFSTLRRLMLNGIGLKPFEFILNERMARAAEYLLNTDEAVAKIGTAVGIPDACYFTRLYTRVYGMSPRKYRERRLP